MLNKLLQEELDKANNPNNSDQVRKNSAKNALALMNHIDEEEDVVALMTALDVPFTSANH